MSWLGQGRSSERDSHVIQIGFCHVTSWSLSRDRALRQVDKAFLCSAVLVGLLQYTSKEVVGSGTKSGKGWLFVVRSVGIAAERCYKPVDSSWQFLLFPQPASVKQ
eukprot:2864038-Rhodomonas_salina.1